MKISLKLHILYFILLSIYLNPLNVLATTIVEIQTSQGDITVQLADDKAPITVANFLSYVEEGFYTQTLFHRVIDGFMIQGGGFDLALEAQEVDAPIVLESNTGLKNKRGTIAMARLSSPDSASAQFFINTEDNETLDYLDISSPGYAVFGEVTAGMEVVDAISTQATGTIPTETKVFRDIPLAPVIIESIRIRAAQLAFTEMQTTYAAGETIIVSLEETMTRQSVLDLWAAVMTESGDLFYITEQGFSLEPSALKTDVPVTDTHHSVFELDIPQGLTGHFTLFAIFNNPGDGITDLNQSIRSNIAEASVGLVP